MTKPRNDKIERQWLADTQAIAGRGCEQLGKLKPLARLAVKMMHCAEVTRHNECVDEAINRWNEDRYRAWCKKKRRRFDMDDFDQWEDAYTAEPVTEFPPKKSAPYPFDDPDFAHARKVGMRTIEDVVKAMEAPAMAGCDHHWEPWRVRRDRICAYCGASESQGRAVK